MRKTVVSSLIMILVVASLSLIVKANLKSTVTFLKEKGILKAKDRSGLGQGNLDMVRAGDSFNQERPFEELIAKKSLLAMSSEESGPEALSKPVTGTKKISRKLKKGSPSTLEGGDSRIASGSDTGSGQGGGGAAGGLYEQGEGADPVESESGLDDPGENPPSAANISVNTLINRPVEIVLSAQDADGDMLNFLIVSNPRKGSLQKKSAATYVYTPNLNFVGVDTFTYKAHDGFFDSNVATVTVNVEKSAGLWKPITSPMWVNKLGTLFVTNEIILNMISSNENWGTAGTSTENIITQNGGVKITIAVGERFGNEGLKTTRAFGLSAVNENDYKLDTIDYAFLLRDDQTMQIHEDGAVKGSAGRYEAGDALSIERSSGIVRYSRNGDVVYTSDKRSTEALYIETSFKQMGALIAYPMYYNTEGTSSGQEESAAEDQSKDTGDDSNPETASPDDNDSTALNQAPVAYNTSQETFQNINTVVVQLSARDPDNDNLTYIIVTTPTRATIVSGPDSSGRVVLSTSLGYIGVDTFTYKVTDGQNDSNVASVTLNILASGGDGVITPDEEVPPEDEQETSPPPVPPLSGNAKPVAYDEQWMTTENVPLAITLGASDPDGDILSFIIKQGPVHGTLSQSGTGENIIYTPQKDYIGTDQLTFVASDGQMESDLAVVTIIVQQSGKDWQPLNESLWTRKKGNLFITDILAMNLFSSSEEWGECGAMTEAIISQEGGVQVSIVTGGKFGDENLKRTRIFGLSENADGDYLPGTMSYAILLNEDQTFQVYDNGEIAAGMSGTYASGDVLSVERISNQIVFFKNGTALHTSGSKTDKPLYIEVGFKSSGAFFTYPNYYSRGGVVSNEPPVAFSSMIDVYQNEGTVTLYLAASDPENGLLAFQIVTPPLYVAIESGPDKEGKIVLRIPSDYAGMDVFTFLANDGFSDSNTATVRINVLESPDTQPPPVEPPPTLPVNRMPVASDETVTTHVNVPLAITLKAYDPDGDPLTYMLVDKPLHGAVSQTGIGPEVLYTPNLDYVGTDRLTFQASEGNLESNLATVSIVIEEAAKNWLPLNSEAWINQKGSLFISDNIVLNLFTSREDWGTAGAVTGPIIVGDGGFRVGIVTSPPFGEQSLTTNRAFGLCKSGSVADYQPQTMDFGFILNGNATFQVVENGQVKGEAGTYSSGDIFSIERRLGMVYYYKNSEVLYSTGQAVEDALFLEVALKDFAALIAEPLYYVK